MKKSKLKYILILIFIGIGIGMISTKIYKKNMPDIIQYPISEHDQKILTDLIKEKAPDIIFDSIWKKTFHYMTFFEGQMSESVSNVGFNVSRVGTGTITNDNTGLTITTSGASGDNVRIIKTPNYQGLVTFSQKSNFRTNLQLGSVASETVYILAGSTSSSYYGFKIVGSLLYGVTSDGSTENTVLLATISSGTGYNLEARYTPTDKVTFYVDSVLKGNSTANLPQTSFGTIPAVNLNLFEIKITTNTTATKSMNISFVEYLQARNTLQ